VPNDPLKKQMQILMRLRRVTARVPLVGLTLVGLLFLALPASATVTSFTATLTSFVAAGNGLSASPTPLQATGCPLSVTTGIETCASASGQLVSYSSAGFAIGGGVFADDFFFPEGTLQGGTIPLSTIPGGFYVLGQVVNQSSGPGVLAAGGGPSGGFGGALSTGIVRRLLIGTSPLPNVFGSLRVLSSAGTPGGGVATGVVLGVSHAVTVLRSGWTTGTITYDDTLLGTALPSGTQIPNRFATMGTAMGSNQLGPNGGSIRLVTPVTLRILSSRAFDPRADDLRAGYHVLEFTLFPEPTTLMLLGVGSGSLLVLGRRERLRQLETRALAKLRNSERRGLRST
jgi:hypothetical protein